MLLKGEEPMILVTKPVDVKFKRNMYSPKPNPSKFIHAIVNFGSIPWFRTDNQSSSFNVIIKINAN